MLLGIQIFLVPSEVELDEGLDLSVSTIVYPESQARHGPEPTPA